METHLLSNIICDKKIEGRLLPHNIKIVAAANPFKKRREKAMQAEKIGLMRPNSRQPLMYNVQPLTPGVMSLAWDFGQLGETQELDYIKTMIKDVQFMNDKGGLDVMA